ncbi:hypothetical protein [Erythrobacter sp.]|uniref:hypothetical protein n=1 Tax=Erythrobacter sp. TaxID=1042 RepID=UPI0025FDBEF6|nr:hypothetical protein [Erythrobacter sp.]
MAEIPVTHKSNKSWLWLLLVLLLLALLIWWLLADDDEAIETTEPVAIEQTEPMMTEPAGVMTIAAILENPQTYYGRDGFTAEVGVDGPLTDRGFWITDDAGNRMFALVIDEPREVPIDINPGQRLRITGGTVRNPSDTNDIPGVPLDDDTIRTMQDQQAVLVVNEDNIEILEAA